MKKIIGLVVVGILVVSASVLVFADDSNLPNWFGEMIKWRQERLEQAREDGYITQEEADQWNQHFEDMEEYHKENGFPNQAVGFPGGCHGGGFGSGFGPRGNSRGFGPGMMNGGFYNNQNIQNQ